jgi:hypothetical protein
MPKASQPQAAWRHVPARALTLRPQCVTEVANAPSRIFARCGVTRPSMVRRSQSMGVHPRLRRGDAASGLSSSGGRFQARRDMTRLRSQNSTLIFGPQFLKKFRTRNPKPETWNLELGTWNLELGTWPELASPIKDMNGLIGLRNMIRLAFLTTIRYRDNRMVGEPRDAFDGSIFDFAVRR